MSTLSELIAAVNEYSSRSGISLNSAQIEALKEIRARLLRLESQYVGLMRTNGRLLETDSLLPQTSFDPDTDTITIRGQAETRKIKLKRADPGVPIRVVGSATTAGYHAGSQEDEGEERRKLKVQMESLLEDFYHSAHRIQKLVPQLTGGSRAKSTKVTIVRNKLIEHPDPSDFYSFGYSSNGPTVRPLHRAGREWIDEGLVPNVADFVAKMIAALR